MRVNLLRGIAAVVFLGWLPFQVTALPKDIIFLARAAESNEQRDRDSKWDAFASRQMGTLLERFSGQVEARDLFVNDLEVETFSNQILSALGPDERFRGLVILGHGGYDFFYIPTLPRGAKSSSLSGSELSRVLGNVILSGRSSREVFCYSNACSNFMRINGRGLASDLAKGLVPFTEGPHPRLDRVDLLGHLGMAGFAEWLPGFPTDWAFKKLNISLDVMGFNEAIQKYVAILLKTSLLGYGIGYGSLLFTKQAMIDPWILGTALPLFVLWGIQRTLQFHYVAKSGRHIILSKGLAYLNSSDGDVWIRNGLRDSMRSHSACQSALAKMRSLRVLSSNAGR